MTHSAFGLNWKFLAVGGASDCGRHLFIVLGLLRPCGCPLSIDARLLICRWSESVYEGISMGRIKRAAFIGHMTYLDVDLKEALRDDQYNQIRDPFDWYTFQEVDEKGHIRRSSSYAVLDPALSTYWEDKVCLVAVRDISSGGALVLRFIVSIKPEAVSEFWQLEYGDAARMVDELFESLSWKELGTPLLHSRWIMRNNSNVLFVEYENGADRDIMGQPEEIVLFARDVEAEMRRMECSRLPHMYKGMIIFPNLWYSIPEAGLVVASPSVIPPDVPGLDVVPSAVFNVVNLLHAIFVLEALPSQLRKLPLYGSSIASYLTLYPTASDLLGYYESEYLVEKGRSLVGASSVNCVVAELSTNLGDSVYKEMIEVALQEPMAIAVTDKYAARGIGSVLARVLVKHENVLSLVKSMLESHIDQLDETSEYLRDYAGVQAARTNIAIQKRLEGLAGAAVKLTVLAIVVAVIAILSNLYSDEVRGLVRFVSQLL